MRGCCSRRRCWRTSCRSRRWGARRGGEQHSQRPTQVCPLLYTAFNTFQPVHDAILRVLGSIGGDGPRSPLDPTDSLVIPAAVVAALWVWRRPPLEAEGIRARLALLATVAAALASVATSYETDWGIAQVGRTASGTLGAVASPTYLTADGTFPGYESSDGGLTWTARKMVVPLERQEWQEWDEREVREPSAAYFKVDNPHIIRTYEGSSDGEVVYSYEYLLNGGNRWMQALDKRDVENRVIARRALDLFYDDQSGNLIVAMGLQGVVVVAPDETSTRVAVGRYSPTDFSFGSKARTFFSSLLHRETVASTGLAFLLTFSFATLALASSGASAGPRLYFALAAAISALLAVSVGVYPHVLEYPWEADSRIVGDLALLLSGFGLFPLLLAIGAMAFARTSRRQVLAVAGGQRRDAAAGCGWRVGVVRDGNRNRELCRGWTGRVGGVWPVDIPEAHAQHAWMRRCYAPSAATAAASSVGTGSGASPPGPASYLAVAAFTPPRRAQATTWGGVSVMDIPSLTMAADATSVTEGTSVGSRRPIGEWTDEGLTS